MSKKMFRYCEKCGGPLIERLPNGVWVFIYGGKVKAGEERETAPVIIKIQGSLKMRCFRRQCRLDHPDHWNIFHYFPDGALFQSIKNQREDVEYNRTGISQNKSDKKENNEGKEVI